MFNGFKQGFKYGGKAYKGQRSQFKNWSRMQAHMSFSQASVLGKQITMIQAAQQNLTATNMMILNLQMNYLLLNDQAESDVNPNSEDLGKSSKFF